MNERWKRYRAWTVFGVSVRWSRCQLAQLLDLMIADVSPLIQTFLGTLLTWGLTALGAGVIFVTATSSRKLLDGSLGFAAGVMTAASYWSLLDPAIDLSYDMNYGSYTFVPAVVGFVLGAAFVYFADFLMPQGADVVSIAKKFDDAADYLNISDESGGEIRRRHIGDDDSAACTPIKSLFQTHRQDVRRILLMVVAITVHNIPEGLAVGVGFGAIGETKSATFENARNLAIGIGIQNFPEGLAVSLPLRASGISLWQSFWYGQLSGLVEPIAGLLGCLAVQMVRPILPYALSFAAGAMIFVVFDDIIPEANSKDNGKLASVCTVIGFVVMMSLDVGLG